MTYHSETGSSGAAPPRARRDAGRRADLSGRSAEARIAAEYDRMGYDLLEARWRGQSGEIDLIFSQDDVLIFVEVKAARDFDLAVASLRPAQIRRIHSAASEYLACAPKGQLSEVRFDLAIVDGSGEARIMENAFSHF